MLVHIFINRNAGYYVQKTYTPTPAQQAPHLAAKPGKSDLIGPAGRVTSYE